nr:CRISPR-associated protein Cas4 [Candidatus Freyarchaeota archaeon]
MADKQGSEEAPYVLRSGEVITGKMVCYYYICMREVWLVGRGIAPDEDFEALDMGRLLHEVYYQRMRRGVALDGIKIDLVKGRYEKVCEVKKSSKHLEAAKMQMAYYLYRLREAGINITGEVLIPSENKKIEIILTHELEEKLLKSLKEIRDVVDQERCRLRPRGFVSAGVVHTKTCVGLKGGREIEGEDIRLHQRADKKGRKHAVFRKPKGGREEISSNSGNK